jgi:integrase
MPGRSGQAPALSIPQWKLWLEWLRDHAGPRVYFVIMLTGALGLRCSEALSLKREDISLSAAIPKVLIAGHTPGATKSPGDVYVRKHHLCLMRGYLRNGITAARTRGHKHGKGTRRTITYKQHWDIPGAGYIFRGRHKASKGHLHYQAVYSAVKREAPKFARFLAQQGKPVSPEVAKLRPHSGRATLITELMGEGMVTALSMKYARHAPDSYKVHLKYGRLTLDDVKAACDALRGSRRTTQWSTMTTQALLQAQKAIAGELQVRLQKK